MSLKIHYVTANHTHVVIKDNPVMATVLVLPARAVIGYLTM
jgi:hypothetical protein